MSKKSKKKEAEQELEKEKKKRKKASKKSDKESGGPPSGVDPVSPEQRQEMIATAAYFIAQRHGFTPGESDADWQAAEKEIDALLIGGTQQGKGSKKKKKK